jgi:hypothetical protein
MCLIYPAPRKKPSKKSPSKSAASASQTQSHPAARITNNATTSHSHTVEFPTSHLPSYLSQKAPSTIPAIQITPATTDTPSPFQYLDPASIYTTTTTAIPTWSVPSSNPSGERTHRNARRASILSEIDFVQTLSSELAPAPSPKGPSESEKKMQAEIQMLGDAIRQRERDEEIAAAVAKTKADMLKKEKDSEAQKQQQQKQLCSAGLCGCCSGNTGATKAVGQDGFVFHLHTHPNGITLENGAVDSGGLGGIDALAGGSYERRRNSVGDMAIGYAKRVMDRMRRIEARTALLETEMEMGWERDLDRERRRYWERERERDRYPSNMCGRGYF